MGLLEPQTKADQQELEQRAELILKAIINAANAVGQIDPKEIQRIAGKLQKAGADAKKPLGLSPSITDSSSMP